MNDATLTPLNPTPQNRIRETGAIQTRIDAAAAKGGGRVTWNTRRTLSSGAWM